jgi:hypothetical protein
MKKYMILSALIGSIMLQSIAIVAMPRHDHRAYAKHQKHHKHHKMHKMHGNIDATYK